MSTRISEAQWNTHKERLRSLYFVHNEGLERIVERAAREFGFHAT